MKKTTFIMLAWMVMVVSFGCKQPVESKSQKSTQELIKDLEDSLFNAETNTLDKKPWNCRVYTNSGHLKTLTMKRLPTIC